MLGCFRVSGPRVQRFIGCGFGSKGLVYIGLFVCEEIMSSDEEGLRLANSTKEQLVGVLRGLLSQGGDTLRH